jgi:hypothetical protein
MTRILSSRQKRKCTVRRVAPSQFNISKSPDPSQGKGEISKVSPDLSAKMILLRCVVRVIRTIVRDDTDGSARTRHEYQTDEPDTD